MFDVSKKGAVEIVKFVARSSENLAHSASRQTDPPITMYNRHGPAV